MECFQQKSRLTATNKREVKLIVNTSLNEIVKELNGTADYVFGGLTEDDVRQMCIEYCTSMKKSIMEKL
jgi:hypothetical protein